MNMRDLYSLDTSILVALVRGGSLGQYIKSTYRLSDLENMPLVSIVTHGEIRSFAKQQKWGNQKLDAIQNILNNSVTVDISDETVIQAYVELDYFLKCVCKPAIKIDQNDIWIAAAAKATDSILLTTDKHFMNFPVRMLKYEYIDQNIAKRI